MTKNHQSKNPHLNKRAIIYETLNPKNDNTRIPYIVIPLYLLEIQNANILRLLLELIKNTRDFPRLEIYNGQIIKIPPRSGILKGGVLAVKWHVDKSSVWRWVRWLEKQKLVQRTMQRYHSLYTLTNRAFPVIKWNSVQSSKEQLVNPPVNPCLSIKYPVLNKDIDIKSGVMNKFRMTAYDLATTQGLILKNSPCSDWKDSGLSREKIYWLITGVCLLNHRDCSEAKSFCLPHLKRFSDKLKKYPLRDPTAVKKYIEVMLGDFRNKRR